MKNKKLTDKMVYRALQDLENAKRVWIFSQGFDADTGIHYGHLTMTPQHHHIMTVQSPNAIQIKALRDIADLMNVIEEESGKKK